MMPRPNRLLVTINRRPLTMTTYSDETQNPEFKIISHSTLRSMRAKMIPRLDEL